MNLAAEILVIILSVTLTIFLIFAIILTVYLINLTRKIRNVTASAERTMDGVETVVSQAVKMSIPMFIAEIVAKFVKKSRKDKGEK